MERLEPRPDLPRPRQAAGPAQVPRRFGMGTLLLLVTVYGLLFSLLQAAGAPAMTYLLVGGFLTMIALGQMLLFGGKKPRLASFLTGGACGSLFAVFGPIFDQWSGDPDWPNFLFEAFVTGGLLGYATGCLLAGVFLLLKPFQKRDADTVGASPFGPEDPENRE